MILKWSYSNCVLYYVNNQSKLFGLFNIITESQIIPNQENSMNNYSGYKIYSCDTSHWYLNNESINFNLL